MSSMALAEYLGIHAALDRLDHDRRLELRGARRARRGGDPRRAVRRGASASTPSTPRRIGSGAGRERPRSARAGRRGATRCSSGRCPTACACRWAPTPSRPAGTWPSTARPPSSSRRSRCSTRQWAAMNPQARYRDPITVDDVLASPMQVAPLHKLDCCLVTDGAGAFVMTTAERARDLRKPPVYVLGAGTAPRPLDDQPDARPHHDTAARCRARTRSAWPASSPTTSTC